MTTSRICSTDFASGSALRSVERARGARKPTGPARTDLSEGGRPAGGTHTVVLRFADAEQARAVYESEQYRELLEERLAATRPFTAMIVPTL
ncbi:DUF1330 domain-containing protein [Kitasatospora sp. NPDC093550]|uniref:DUF1330 domain-containing protein n=1 Tax=Kitasatospora sp. NPDC093550 TaxID=3364089 RepID=UPI00383098A6